MQKKVVTEALVRVNMSAKKSKKMAEATNSSRKVHSRIRMEMVDSACTVFDDHRRSRLVVEVLKSDTRRQSLCRLPRDVL